MRKLLLFLVLLLPICASAQRYKEQINFNAVGDQEMSLGRYRIGTAIRLECQIAGSYAEDGGIYHTAADWGQLPKVVYRGESSITNRLTFYGYVDPATNSYMFLFATWDNLSVNESQGNNVQFTIYSEGSIDLNNFGSFSNAAELENLLISQSSLGAVGIGSVTSGYKFTVDGKILAEEVRVQTVPASDYVFEPDYNLPSLYEVDSFIQQNKHLPDIPSAEEFKENGVGLGEMDDMLLRKIEELTLYIIGQEKRMSELEKKNENQTKEIQELKTKLN